MRIESALEQLREHSVDAGLEFAGPRSKVAELEVRGGELLLEDLVVEIVDLGADVAARVEAEALRLDLRDRRDLAQAVDVDVGAVGEPLAEQPLAPVANSGSSPR